MISDLLSRGRLALAFGLVAACGPNESADPASHNGRTELRQAWTRYTTCRNSRDFRPCFGLLSVEARRDWKDSGGATPDEYYDVKGSEPVGYRDFNLVTIRKSDSTASVIAEATRTGEAGVRRTRIEYVFVKEPDGWKILKIREGGRDFAP